MTTPSSLHSDEGTASRIYHSPVQCGGRPCVRGMRIRVTDVLDLLGEELSPQSRIARWLTAQAE